MKPLFVVLNMAADNLHSCLSFSPAECDLAISISQRLPAYIIDAHAHCQPARFVYGIDKRAYHHMLSSFPDYPLSMLHCAQSLLFPNIKVRSLIFSNVFRGIDYQQVNQYLLKNSNHDDRVALFGAAENSDYVVREINTGKYAAVKMYYLHNLPTAERIQSVFPPIVLKAAEQYGMPIILHLPKMIAYSVDDILQLKQDYPDLKVTICHLGSSEIDAPNLADSIRVIARETDFMTDTALNHRSESIRLALEHFGPQRMMFGTDLPLSLLRSVPYVHPDKGGRIVTKEEFHWSDPIEHAEYCHLATSAVHSHWAPIQNLLDVIEQDFGIQANATKRAIFYDNAASFYHFM